MEERKLETSRRGFLATGIGLLGVVFGRFGLARADNVSCQSTIQQVEGPFYPIDRLLDTDTDLTIVQGRSGRAEGEVIYVRGRVLDEHCKPIPGVLVEIWQANAKGRYNHPGDRNNPVPLDPNFQGTGKTVSDQTGRYLFKTIHPGSYPAGDSWVRPSHVHFKVNKRGFKELTTQMFFEGDPKNEKDFILKDVPEKLRSTVVIKPEPSEAGFDPSGKIYNFDITLETV